MHQVITSVTQEKKIIEGRLSLPYRWFPNLKWALFFFQVPQAFFSGFLTQVPPKQRENPQKHCKNTVPKDLPWMYWVTLKRNTAPQLPYWGQLVSLALEEVKKQGPEGPSTNSWTSLELQQCGSPQQPGCWQGGEATLQCPKANEMAGSKDLLMTCQKSKFSSAYSTQIPTKTREKRGTHRVKLQLTAVLSNQTTPSTKD